MDGAARGGQTARVATAGVIVGGSTFKEERVRVFAKQIVAAGLCTLACAAVAGLAGCNGLFSFMNDPPKAAPPIEYVLSSPYSGTQVIAIAPAVNVSGSRDFDPLAVSDTMYGELQQVAGLTVLPLNKTIAAMQKLRMRTIDSPEAAANLAAAMGADGILMVSVTAYDPYVPPTVGMTVQLYTVKDPDELPVTSVASAEGNVKALRADGSVLDVAPPPAPLPKPVTPEEMAAKPARHLAASISAVFNGSNQTVRQELRDFAAGRTNYDSALGMERFLRDSDAYMRFVCHAMVHRLIEVERDRVAGR